MTSEQLQEWYRWETLRMRANITAMQSRSSRSDAGSDLWWALLAFFLGFVIGGMW